MSAPQRFYEIGEVAGRDLDLINVMGIYRITVIGTTFSYDGPVRGSLSFDTEAEALAAAELWRDRAESAR